jgi:hypothetical protein
MKTLLLTLIATCLGVASTPAGTPTVYATHGEPFEMTGFVVGYQGGNCVPPKFAYQLQSTDHRTNFWLCATGSNEVALRRAMLDGGIYCVNGTLQLGAENPYVEVDNVHWY